MPPQRQLVYVVAALVLLLGYNRFAGLHPDSTWLEVWIDSIEEMGIGLLLSGCFFLTADFAKLDDITTFRIKLTSSRLAVITA